MTVSDALRESLLKAEKGSRELDLEIWKLRNPEAVEVKGIWTANGDAFVAHHTSATKGRYERVAADSVEWVNESSYTRHSLLPPYTSCLQAATLLLPKHALWCVGSMEAGPFARVLPPNRRGGYLGSKETLITAATPPLALCIAALSATQETP